MVVRPRLAATNRYSGPESPDTSPPARISEAATSFHFPPPLGDAANETEPGFDDTEEFEPPAAAARVYQSRDVIAGKYELDRVLGEGGMGSVWVARNRDLDVDVAIKLIRADSAVGDSADRLLREARAAAALSGPAIVRIFDFGVSQFGDPFIAMELLEGEDLAHALARRGRLSPIKAVRIILPIIQALGSAHALSIVHRDLKPENIFLAKTPNSGIQPKLLDFGVAKLGRGRALRLTQTGAMLGSPLYMSPEQARGDEVDLRADLWAICVVLYEVISGRAPFDGKNYNAVLYSIIANEPPPTPSLGAGDEGLWAIIERGLKKNPDHRWPSMLELGQALARWLISHDTLDDITGVSLQASWLGNQHSGRSDPLETMQPPPDPSAGGETLLRHLPTIRRLSGKAGTRRRGRKYILFAALAGVVVAVLFVSVVRLFNSPAEAVQAQDLALAIESPASGLPAPIAEAPTPELAIAAAPAALPLAEATESEPKKTSATTAKPSPARPASSLKNTAPRTPLKRLKNPFQ